MDSAAQPGHARLWAPDISYSHGEYRLYYTYSLFGKNTSGIALATNKTLAPKSKDYKWVDRGLVLESKATDDFNAIDPNYLEDARHQCVAGIWKLLGRHQDALARRGGGEAVNDRHAAVFTDQAREAPNAEPAKPGLPPDLAGAGGVGADAGAWAGPDIARD